MRRAASSRSPATNTRRSHPPRRRPQHLLLRRRPADPAQLARAGRGLSTSTPTATMCSTCSRRCIATTRRALAFAHVGGRYADLHAGHDVAIERSVEVHSSWGTFEWLLFDAFELGYRVGVVCNSDDHKGRPGASHPGASIFGAYGGLSCLYLDELSRDAIWRCMQARHHYGTTGDRLHLAVDVRLRRRGVSLRGRPAPRCRRGARTGAARDDGRHRARRAGPGDGPRCRRRRRPDRAHRPALRRAHARDDPAVRAGRSGPAHPRDLGRRRVPRARPHDDLGRFAADHRQRDRARSSRSTSGTSTSGSSAARRTGSPGSR